MQRRHIPENSAKTNGEKLYKNGKRQAQAGNHVAAISDFDACLELLPQNYYAMLEKAKSHFALDQLGEAIVAFEKVAIASATLRDKAKGEIAKIVIHCNQLSSSKILSDFHPAILPREVVIAPAYAEEFDALTKLHGQMPMLDFNDQVSAIIRMIDLCINYYTKGNGEYPHIHPDLLGDTKKCQAVRLRLIGNAIAKSCIVSKTRNASRVALLFANMLETESLEFLPNIAEDHCRHDATTIIRMIFQAIHQLPREKRGELVTRMPWGDNSWYHLEFCSTFFCNVPNRSIAIGVGTTCTPEEQKSILQFKKYLALHLVLVKLILPDIFKVDLPAMRSFFASVRNGLAANDATKMQELPNLRMLLWHFKHSYQLLKLTAILPNKFKKNNEVAIALVAPPNESEMIGLENEMTGPIIIKPLQQLLMAAYPHEIASHKKYKLSILRRIQIVGEVFSTRNWGSQLNDLAFLDPKIFADIRNGLCHPDELNNPAAIEAIESDSQRITNIFEELVSFKQVIFRVIIDRQKNFPDFTDDDLLPHHVYTRAMPNYWQTIKDLYPLPVISNGSDYCPGKQLLSDDEMLQVSHLLDGCSAYDKILSMLSGDAPFTVPDELQFNLEEKYPYNKTPGVKLEGEEKRRNNENKKSLKAVDKLLAKANRAYANSKATYLQSVRVENEKKAEKLNEVRAENMQAYPTICKLAKDIFAYFNNEADNRPPMDRENLLRFLQQRIEMLRELIMEIPYYERGGMESAELKRVVCNDVDLLFAMIYLYTQIISILNKLNSLQVLNLICQDLSDNIEPYIQIRNALEHSDPVVDSLEDSYVQMSSKSHLLLCESALELCTKYYTALTKIDAKVVERMSAIDRKPEQSVKQRKALTLSASGSLGLFSTLTKDELEELPSSSDKSDYIMYRKKK